MHSDNTDNFFFKKHTRETEPSRHSKLS